MVKFQGFKTKEQAIEFQKKHGGMLCSNDKNKQDYRYAILLGGLDEKKYPYCVQWNV
jgi:hypothetical protein